jgi:hypothetical protein
MQENSGLIGTNVRLEKSFTILLSATLPSGRAEKKLKE